MKLVVLLLVYPAVALECLTGSYGCADQEKVELLQVRLDSVKGSERSGKGFSPEGVPSFEIDLALEPEQRWLKVARRYKPALLQLQKNLNPKIRLMRLSADVPMSSEELDRMVGRIFARKAYEEYDRELQGIANVVNENQKTPVTLQWLRLLNVLFELDIGIACTGVLAAKADGTMVHGRNMDWGGRRFAGFLRDITFEAKYLDESGRTVFKTTQWPGEVGARTAMRFDGGWAIQQNLRSGQGHKDSVQQRLSGDAVVSSLFVRSALQHYSSYSKALDSIFCQRFMKPMYLIMSGAGKFQGAVLTVDGRDKTEIRKITSKPKSWFLVQGNRDHIEKTRSKFTNDRDRKRGKAEALLEDFRYKFGQGIVSEDFMMKFMHMFPLLQDDTVFSTVMVPSQNYYLTDLPDLDDIRAGFPWRHDRVDPYKKGWHKPNTGQMDKDGTLFS